MSQDTEANYIEDTPITDTAKRFSNSFTLELSLTSGSTAGSQKIIFLKETSEQ